jgi:hypothetical protein
MTATPMSNHGVDVTTGEYGDESTEPSAAATSSAVSFV